MDEVDTEEKRKKRFMKGLSPFMKMQLRLTKPKEFQELVDAAITLEDDYKLLQEERRKKARMEPRKFQVQRQPPNLRFRPKLRTEGRKPIPRSFKPVNNLLCNNCGMRGHLMKDCQKPKIICFGCGQAGHIKPDCPNKQNQQVSRENGGGSNQGGGGFKPRNGGFGRNMADKNKGKPYGRLNCTSLEQVNNTDNVVIGTLKILSHHGKVMFDTGATTSFISQQFVDAYGIRCQPLEVSITVMSAGGKLLVTQVKMDQVIMICDRVYDADLLVIPMKDIAVILGMDWLSDHGAQIDCA